MKSIDSNGRQTRARSNLHTAFVRYCKDGVDEDIVFQMLMQQYSASLLRYICGVVQNEHDAEEVLQEVYTLVATRHGGFREERAVRPWLYSIAHNSAIDFLRRKRKHRREVQYSLHEDESVSTEALIQDSQPEPVDQMLNNEREYFVKALLARLREKKNREVVELVYMQGNTYQEAADALCIPIGTVKSRLHTAMIQLRELAQSAGEP